MTRLLVAEFGRLRSRRSFWVLALAALLLLGAFQLFVNSEVSPPGAAEIAQEKAAYQQAEQEYQAQSGQEQADCLDNGGTPQECAQQGPQLSDFLRTPETYASAARTSLTIGVVLGWLLSFLVGGSSIGAEYSTGSLGNWLTFVPRRGAVFASKLVSVVVGCAVLTGVLAVVGLVVPAVLVQAHGGQVAGVARLAALAGRGVGLAAALAVLGFCLGTLFRHTVAALGVALGYLLFAFVRGSILGGVAWAQRITPWMPEANVLAVYLKSFPYELPPAGSVVAEGSADPVVLTVTLNHGLSYLVVVLVVLVVLTGLVFRRRDVA